MIHPFSDGNGRWPVLTTLILGREQIIEPPFCSIEEYLGRYTQSIHVLASGQGAYHPENDPRRGSNSILWPFQAAHGCCSAVDDAASMNEIEQIMIAWVE